MSWNSVFVRLCSKYHVSASLWGCELKYAWSYHQYVQILSASLWGCELKWYHIPPLWLLFLSASLWGCELKYMMMKMRRMSHGSASLWGCELKYRHIHLVIWHISVSLLVRLWVEIRNSEIRQRIWPGQPPCEAVSWNMLRPSYHGAGGRSASLWGCELKWCKSVQKPKTGVSLLVRLWVEISVTKNALYGDTVSLLVRLWVEIEIMEDCTIACQSSASLWGCELK